MKELIAVVVLTLLFAQRVSPQALDPQLFIRELGTGQIEITWPSDISGYSLEASDTLGSVTNWRPAGIPVQRQAEFVVTVAVNGKSQFLRLRDPGAARATTIKNSSPLDGEEGVAVTRETILYFTNPLEASAVIDHSKFFATFGGRKLLSRVELSSDRTRASLFYLEPLPGSAVITVSFDGSAIRDASGMLFDADGDGLPGGAASLQFTTLNITPHPGTGVTGHVFAAEKSADGSNVPLAGVTITVDGMEETLRTVTDSSGRFTLIPAPSGRFFVHIDGRTIVNDPAGIRYPDKAYYPYVGKAWEAVAGRTNNPAGGTGLIYLPLILPGTLQPVSAVQDTTVSFPPSVVSTNAALAGVSITVPANSLFHDDGTRGGKVGLAAVPPDRLPGPLPPGANLPLVITVQTDGALNFDRPAPVCFPNLPDALTGKPWPAGAKGALISFNHKKGEWEVAGSMTVSADGKAFCTDPGAGVLQPGWHGVQAPQPVGPPPPPEFCGQNLESYKACLQAILVTQRDCERKYRRLQKLSEEEFLFWHDQGNQKKENEAKKRYLDDAHAERKLCPKYNDEFAEFCGRCFGRRGPSPDSDQPPGTGELLRAAAAGEHDEGIWAALGDIFSQVALVITPSVTQERLLTPDEVDELRRLNATADSLVGGNVDDYLRELIEGTEIALVSIAESVGMQPEDLNPDNAPPYQIYYAAQIHRPTGSLILRGETQPRGQYLLYPPADGFVVNVQFYDPKTKRYGVVFPNLRASARYLLPRLTLLPLLGDETDSDGDGLADVVEHVLGTDPTNADSDGDRISDRAELEQGTNPLDGFVVQTGVIATAKTPGPALDVWTGNELIVTAEGTSGISIFGPYLGKNPTILSHVPLPGSVQRLAGSGDYLAVAAGTSGLFIIDISNPASVRILHNVNLPGAQAVAADATTAYTGLASGEVVAVGLKTGAIGDRTAFQGAIQDLAIEGDYLYVLTADRLLVISLKQPGLRLVGEVASPFVAAPNSRLFVGGGIAYSAHNKGYNTIDVSKPELPRLLAQGNTAQFGWRQVVANGSGVGVATVGPNSTDDGPHDVSLYDLSDPLRTDRVITTLPTPGLARSVSLLNGLAYVADNVAGLQVLNYLAYDTKGVAPNIQLKLGSATGAVEQRKPARVTAIATDDVQVRSVELFLDGVWLMSDGNFPFEFRFLAPVLSAEKKSFRVQARAFDTGGNSTWSDELTARLVEDATPPRVTSVLPGTIFGSVSVVTANFDAPVNAGTINSTSFKILSAGPDGQLGTEDDLEVPGGTVAYHAENSSATLSYAAPLADGTYRAVIMSTVTDLAGNQMDADYAWLVTSLNPILAGPITSPVNKHVYYLLKQATWTDAERVAVSLGGHLATVRTDAENKWIYDTFIFFAGNFRHLWIGLYDPDPAVNATDREARREEFVWASGEPVTFSSWQPDEPNHPFSTDPAIPELYVHMWSSLANAPYTWNNYTTQQTGLFNLPMNGVVEVIPSAP